MSSNNPKNLVMREYAHRDPRSAHAYLRGIPRQEGSINPAVAAPEGSGGRSAVGKFLKDLPGMILGLALGVAFVMWRTS